LQRTPWEQKGRAEKRRKYGKEIPALDRIIPSKSIGVAWYKNNKKLPFIIINTISRAIKKNKIRRRADEGRRTSPGDL
jgi:hypothetical protein